MEINANQFPVGSCCVLVGLATLDGAGSGAEYYGKDTTHKTSLTYEIRLPFSTLSNPIIHLFNLFKRCIMLGVVEKVENLVFNILIASLLSPRRPCVMHIARKTILEEWGKQVQHCYATL